MNEITENAKITIDGVVYPMENLSDNAKFQITNIKFSDEQILQLQNEWAISNTARTGYIRAFKAEFSRVAEVDG
jgi:hypothetical protein